MKGLGVIFNKEMRRVFREPKMIFSLFILPVILMIGIYGLMGILAQNMEEDVQAHVPVVYMYNVPGEIDGALADFKAGALVTVLDSVSDAESKKAELADGTADLIVVFPENFMEMVQSYQTGDAIPDVAVYYNPSEDYSSEAWRRFNAVLEGGSFCLLCVLT